MRFLLLPRNVGFERKTERTVVHTLILSIPAPPLLCKDSSFVVAGVVRVVAAVVAVVCVVGVYAAVVVL